MLLTIKTMLLTLKTMQLMIATILIWMMRKMPICVTVCLLQGAPRHFFYVILERKIPGHR